MPILYGLKKSNGIERIIRLLYYKKSHQNIISALKLSLKSFFQKNNQGLTITRESPYVNHQNFSIHDIRGQIPKSIYHASYLYLVIFLSFS